MICPFCANENLSIVIHTEKFTVAIRRVRACRQCGMAWHGGRLNDPDRHVRGLRGTKFSFREYGAIFSHGPAAPQVSPLWSRMGNI